MVLSRRGSAFFLACILPTAFSACGGSEAAANRGVRLIAPGSPGCKGEECQRVVAESCKSDDPDHLCLAMKYISFTSSAGMPSATQDQAVAEARYATQIWSQCNIGFQLQEYAAVNPAGQGLSYGSDSQKQTYEIRRQYMENNTFLVVTTGPWNTSTVAWTEPPGNDTHGVVQEGGVVDYPQILAHELGHYMSLDHAADSPNDVPDNVMNWRVYTYSTHLTAAQCSSARAAVMSYWSSMLR